jgi:hypothetical protein
MKDNGLMQIPIPRKLTLDDGNFNPSYDMPHYEWKTFAEYKHERTNEWWKQHAHASAVVVNQDGVPLYALYKAPYADHEEMLSQLFKQTRANMLNEWEEES